MPSTQKPPVQQQENYQYKLDGGDIVVADGSVDRLPDAGVQV